MSSEGFTLVFVRYMDHVLFNRNLLSMVKPQIREAIGWLNYQCEDYIIVSWDRDANTPTLKGGDPKASGLVLMTSAILELKSLQVNSRPLQEISKCHLNSTQPKDKSEYALQSKVRKTLKKRNIT